MAQNGLDKFGLLGYPGLATAVIALAVTDAKKANGHSRDACAFLRSPGAAYLVTSLSDALDLDVGPGDLRELAGRMENGG